MRPSAALAPARVVSAGAPRDGVGRRRRRRVRRDVRRGEGGVAVERRSCDRRRARRRASSSSGSATISAGRRRPRWSRRRRRARPGSTSSSSVGSGGSSPSSTSTTTTVMLSRPPWRVGGGDQLVGGVLRVVDRGEHACDLVVGDLVDEAVAAQQEAVAADERQRPRVDADLRLDAERAGDDVAARVVCGPRSSVMWPVATSSCT